MKTFEEAWAEMEARGYQYGADALENVRFGWNLRDSVGVSSDKHKELGTPPEVAIENVTLNRIMREMDDLVPLNVADLRDPEDPDGRSYRQVNAATQHSIPIGTLVELKDGVRLWVVAHNRDCDSTPLYALCADKEDTVARVPGFANPHWHHGYPESALKVVDD